MMKRVIALVVALIWCIGLSWVSHEIFLDLIETVGIGTAAVMSGFIGLMNLVTTFLLYFFIAYSRDF